MTTRFLVFIFILISNINIVQAQYAPTLLWRISGNGLKHSSYLFGTMHVTKPDMFQFGDSVVAAIKSSKFMATEIAPQQAVLLTQRRMEQYWDDQKEIEKYDTVDLTNINANKDFDSLLFDNLIQLRKKYKIRSSAEPMPVIMDMYLYHYGTSLGLKIGGVEKAVDIDSLEILEASKIINETYDLLYRNEFHPQNLENLHITENLDSIHRLVTKYQSMYNATVSLAPRNLNMIVAMDSLHKKIPSFFAVGVAHLVGENSLIELLRSKGYTVAPVISSKKIDLQFDINKHIKKQKYYSEDSTLSYNSTIPFLLKKSYNGLTNIYYNYDLGERKYYFIQEIFGIPYPEKDADFLQSAKEVISQYLQIENTPDFSKIKVKDGWRQIKFDVLDDSENKYYTGIVISANSAIYITYTSDEESQDLYTKSVSQFLESIKIKPSTKQLKWQNYTDLKNYLSPHFPATPIGSFKKIDSDNNILYNYTKNPKTGDYYLFQHNKANIGYEYADNTATLQTIKNFFLESYKNIEVDSSNFQMPDGVTRNVYYIKNFDDDIIACLFVDVNYSYQNYGFVCGNKLKKSEISQFVEKSKYLGKPNLSEFVNSNDKSFKMSGSNIQKEKSEYERLENETYNVYDGSTGNTAYIYKEPLNKYLHFATDSLLWNYLKINQFRYQNDADSVYFKLDAKQPYIYTKTTDTVLKNVTFESRVYLNGDTIYQINIKAINTLYESGYIDTWFNSLQFLTTYKPTYTQSKVPIFLQDANSNDTLILKDALDNVYGLSYTNSDLPILYNALFSTSTDTSTAANLQQDLLDKLVFKLEREDTLSLFIPIIKSKFETSNSRSKSRILYLLHHSTKQTAIDLFVNLASQYGLPNNDASLFSIYYSKDDSVTAFSKHEKEFTKWLKQKDKLSFALSYFEDNLDNASVPKLLKKENKTLEALINSGNLHIGEPNYFIEPYMYSLIKITTTLKNKTLLKALNRFKTTDNIYFLESLVEQYIKNDIAIESKYFDKLAANFTTRENLFEKLKEKQQTNLYPSQYLTQAHFAESQLYHYAQSDEFYFDTLILVRPWKINIGKQSYNAFIYKINVGTIEEPEYMLAVVGGYDANNISNVEGTLSYGAYIFIDYDNDYTMDDLKAMMQQYAKDLKAAIEEDKLNNTETADKKNNNNK
jgi:hypothetical protein